MRIDKIKIENFQNYENLEVEFEKNPDSTEEELDSLSAIALALELNNLLDGTDSEVIKVNAIIELLNAKKQ